MNGLLILCFCLGNGIHWIAVPEKIKGNKRGQQKDIEESCTVLQVSVYQKHHKLLFQLQRKGQTTCVCAAKTVQEYKVTNYGKLPEEFVMPESASVQDKQWICKTCHNAFKLPAQAKANNLGLENRQISRYRYLSEL